MDGSDIGMTRELWQRVEEIVDRVLDAEAGEREAIIAAACAGDDELRGQVVAFIAACEQAEGLFEHAPTSLARDAFAAEGDPDGRDTFEPGAIIGPYRIVEQIGSGGMGAVYHAERAGADFEQHVALKVIKRGLDTDEIVDRFTRERQILARLQHPNIAALHDGGATPAGLPYFAMEYAPGDPIDRYCDQMALGIEDRLRLFLTVCEAVQYAHGNLVVHRDLKPGNILVANGEAKLLDFGIAKLLDPETGEGATATQLGERRLTPDYAAPEQVLGLPTTTATDVYALGVILYELVTGRAPYKLGNRSLAELERVICRTEAPAPSSAAVGAFQGRVPRDLDAVILKALQKEPERRYLSVAAFAEDLERFLAGHPVRARPDTQIYRLTKFVRRNARLVALTAAAVLALTTGMVAAAVQARIAQHQRDARELEAQRANAARDFLVGWLVQLDPDLLGGQREFTHEELIELGLASLDDLDDQPEVRATAMNTLASVIYNLGADQRERADSLYRAAYALLAGSGDHVELATSLMGMGQAAHLAQEYEEARSYYARAFGMLQRLLDENDPTFIESTNRLAFAIYSLGSAAPDALRAESLLNEADALYSQALARTAPEDHLRRAVALEGLADIRLERGRRAQEAGDSIWAAWIAEAETAYEAAITAAAAASTEITPDYARRMWGLADARAMLGKFDSAIAISDSALVTMTRAYGKFHEDVARAYYEKASQLSRAGHNNAAAQNYERAAEMYGQLGGPDALYGTYALAGAGRRWAEAGQPSRGITFVTRSIPIYEAIARADSTATAKIQGGLFYVFEALRDIHGGLGNTDSAAHYERRMAELSRQAGG